MGNSWRFLKTLKKKITIGFKDPTPGHISVENHNLKTMNTNVYCSTVYNRQDMDAT